MKEIFADAISEKRTFFREITLTLDLSTFLKILAKNFALKSNFSKHIRGSRFGLGRFGSIAKTQTQVR